jgi:hypothetical protein
VDYLESSGTTAFLVIHDDELLYERYFDNYDETSVNTSFSMAKSFASVLVGIAIGEGHIRSVNELITNYIPELLERDERFKKSRRSPSATSSRCPQGSNTKRVATCRGARRQMIPRPTTQPTSES